MNTFKWLLKREFWEHKGGFFWLPIVVGAIMTAFIAVSLGFALLGLKGGVKINMLTPIVWWILSALSKRPHSRRTWLQATPD